VIQITIIVSWHFFLADLSLTDWLEKKGNNISSQLSNVGREALLNTLGLKEFLKSPACDRKRQPYMPALNGWNNGEQNKQTVTTKTEITATTETEITATTKTEITTTLKMFKQLQLKRS